MYLDCDQDALLILVNLAGLTCHRNTESCFNIAPAITLKDIEKIIQDRLKNKERASYTHYLLTEGTDKIAKKNGEEAVEVIIATKNADKKDTVNETADLLYHLGVLLYSQGIAIDDVATVLAERHQKNNNFKGERKDIDVW
jgi:phosphoribosyl-ATP pyrophosphohydrolase/phosphoribosyl-AMP cyclohydrolase